VFHRKKKTGGLNASAYWVSIQCRVNKIVGGGKEGGLRESLATGIAEGEGYAGDRGEREILRFKGVDQKGGERGKHQESGSLL